MDRKTQYNDYLHSKWWLHIKIEVKKKYGGVYCLICDTQEKQIDYHHISYENKGTDREVNDIRMVCHTHHTLCHWRLLGLKKVPLTKRALTKRYNYLRFMKPRHWKPSQILDFIYDVYNP